MSHIYWELHEIPRPQGSYINHSDGRVFLMQSDGCGSKKRRVIGHATSETMMHPNDLYKYLYPAQWTEYYGSRDLPEHELHTGMYALTLGAGYSTGLYPILQDVYGPLYANAIMDYAMYSIMERSNTTQLFTDSMSREVLFSKEAYSDTWYSGLFRTHMPEDLNHQFRIRWLQHCAEAGVTQAWLSIDGSNNDCDVRNGDLPGKGDAKSHTSSNIVSFIWVLDSRSGMPVTYFVNNGGVVDSKAIQKIVTLLNNAGIEIEGAILDRGFCYYDVFQLFENSGYPYIVMLKGNTHGHTSMMSEYASEIKWNVRHVINDDGIFGISKEQKVFTSRPFKTWINLYFDGANGTERSITLIKRIRAAACRMNEDIRDHKKPAVPKDLSAYLSVKQNGRSWKIEYNYDAWQTALDEKGFYSIASSDNFGADAVDRIYHLRDVSEKQYSIMKSQLGYDVARVHSDESMLGKYAECFISAIIRSKLCSTCKSLGYDTNQMIREIDRISLVLMPDGLYASVNNLTVRQNTLLNEFGILPEHFKTIADDVNHRKLNPINSQIHKLPGEGQLPMKKRGRPPKKKADEASELPKRKPGRPKGSKNRKTLEREARQQSEPQPARRGPGRPKGSKNKPKVAAPKRGRGRPRKDANS